MKSKQQKWKIGYKDKSGPEIITDQNDDFVCTLWMLGGEYRFDESTDLTDKMASDRALISKAPEMKRILEKIINMYDSECLTYKSGIEEAIKILKQTEPKKCLNK